jgi:hemerythrin-like domain-containing protein
MPDPMTLLKADHREAKKLLSSLTDSEEGPERERMVEELRQALTLHMELEEQMLYDLVEREVGPEDREEADIEHGLARDGLAKVVELVAMPGFGAAVEMLKAGIEHHVEEEEKEILPELKSNMERADWMALGDELARRKEAAGRVR